MSQQYVLLTAAHNEQDYIEQTIVSVLGQNVQPLKWVIVNDASTDRTEEIVLDYAARNRLIELIHRKKEHGHDFAAKATALRAAYDAVAKLPFSFIGIVDADISFESSYYSTLMSAFQKDANLGLAGGYIYEKRSGVFRSRPSNAPWSVAGAAQLFRRRCYEEIGGIRPLPYGGEDWCAEIAARMTGWSVRASPNLQVFHHRSTGSARGLMSYRYRQGKMDHSVGSLPSFEILKCLTRIRTSPVVLGSLARLAGYAASCCRRDPRAVSPELVEFLQREQKTRIMSLFLSPRQQQHHT